MSINTAAILIIGDEVLNGKIKDTNSHFASKLFFQYGIELKKILVIGDDSDEIIQSVQDLSAKYDFVITSGGIGPTHDDITYESIAKAFNLPLVLHQTTIAKMNKLKRNSDVTLSDEELEAQHRMALFPFGDNVTHIYVDDKLWVPIVSIDSKVHILPGVPQLFEFFLTNLLTNVKERIPKENQFVRYFIKTKLTESQIAPTLTSLQAKGDPYNVKVGSYPHMGLNINTISLLGRFKNDVFIRQLVQTCIEKLEGEEIDELTENEYSKDSTKIN